MSASVEKDCAYILHRRPFKEHQWLIELLTENQGRITARVYLGRKNRQTLQPFNKLNISLPMNTDLPIIKTIEMQGPATPLIGKQLWIGLYMNEIIIKSTYKAQPEHQLFALYHDSIQQLKECIEFVSILRHFETDLLKIAGYALTYDSLHSDRAYHYYDMPRGFIPCAPNHPNALPTHHIKHIAQGGPLDQETHRSHKKLLRQAIDQLVNGKPVHTRALWQPYTKKSTTLKDR